MLVSGSNLVATVPKRLSESFQDALSILDYPARTPVKIRLAWTELSHRAELRMWVRDWVYRLITGSDGLRPGP